MDAPPVRGIRKKEDALLDRFMPVYEAADRRHCRVAAPQGLRWCENQSPLQEEEGPGCKSPFWNLTERSGEVFFLDILSHRLNCLHQMDGWNRDRL
jgi:hypothetical protein